MSSSNFLLRFVNSLGYPAEFRKALYVLLWVHCKGYRLGRAKQKSCIGQGMGHTSSMPFSGLPPSQHLHIFADLDALWISLFSRSFYGGFFTQAWLIKWLATGDWTQSPALSLPKSSNLLITQLPPLATSPHPVGSPKSRQINITKTSLLLSSCRKFQGEQQKGAPCQKGNEYQIYIYNYKLQYHRGYHLNHFEPFEWVILFQCMYVKDNKRWDF